MLTLTLNFCKDLVNHSIHEIQGNGNLCLPHKSNISNIKATTEYDY